MAPDPYPPDHSADETAYCAAVIAPGMRCEHRVEQHVFHGSALLECWRCEDWHHFVPRRPSQDSPRRPWAA